MAHWNNEWSDEEKKTLADLWPNYKADEISLKINRSVNGIKRMATLLKLRKSKKYMKKTLCNWKDNEIDLLKKLNHKKTPLEIADIIGRSVESVRAKLNSLGIEYKKAKGTKTIEYERYNIKPIKGTVSLLDIKDTQCRYTTDKGASMMLCGSDVHEGKSYCTEHCHVVYTNFGELTEFKPLSFNKGASFGL